MELPQKKLAKSKKKKNKPVAVEESHTCDFCKKSFKQLTTISSHACEKKRRWLCREDKQSRMGFIVYRKFFDMNFKSYPPRTFQDFIDSSYYSSFVRFGRHLMEIQALNPEQFIEFVIKASVPMKNWEKEFVYEQFVRELNKKEPPLLALERNILIMKQWELDTNEPWCDFFRKVSTNTASSLIRAGRLSPWVLYTSDSAMEMISRFTEEQMSIIEQSVHPVFWERKFEENKEDVQYIRNILIECGI